MKRRRSTVFKDRWIGRNASQKSLKRYCREIWSDIIREKDQECFLCGRPKDSNFVAHHMITRKWYPTSFESMCGVLLCKNCHSGGLFSAHVSPWVVESKMKKERPEQYRWILSNRSKMHNEKQEIPDYRQILNRLLAEYEKIRPTQVVRSGYFKFSENEEKQIVHEFVDLSSTVRLLAEKWECSHSCISGILRRHEVSLSDGKYRRRNKEMIRRICGSCVLKLDSELRILAEYPSLAKAAQEHGLTKNAVRNCVKGLSKSSAGFKWMLKKDWEKELLNTNDNA